MHRDIQLKAKVEWTEIASKKGRYNELTQTQLDAIIGTTLQSPLPPSTLVNPFLPLVDEETILITIADFLALGKFHVIPIHSSQS